MIPKSGNRFSEQDHAQTKSWTMVRFNLIGSWSRAVELVAHTAENRPHRHIDVVIGEIHDPAVRCQGAEVIKVSFDAQDPVAGQQQFATEADGPADSRAGCFEGHRTDGTFEMVVNLRKCHAAL